MKEKEFDNLIRARLKNHESPVPTGMWDRITLKSNKRRKGFTTRLYLLTILFLFVGLAGSLSIKGLPSILLNATGVLAGSLLIQLALAFFGNVPECKDGYQSARHRAGLSAAVRF